jgi:hypothetical protein
MTEEELRAYRGTPAPTGDGKATGAEVSSSGLRVVTAEELGAVIDGPVVTPSPQMLTAAQRWTDSYKAALLASGEKYVEEKAREDLEGPTAGIGAITHGTYVSYDIVALSPIQLAGGPPFGPHKLVAGGRPMMLQAVQWINPRVDIANGFIVPATTQLSGRHLRVRFNQLNLTTGIAGPSFNVDVPALSAPAPTFIVFSLFMNAPNVTQAELYEVNITSDIVGMAQPYAAFATWHHDRDEDRPWFAPAPPNFPPPVPAQWLHGIPMRYMVFPE